MNGSVDWAHLADLASRVRSAFEPECLAAHDAMMRSRILNAIRLVPSLTSPRTVDLDQGVLESVFGEFRPGHAFKAFTPDWGIKMTELQATRGLSFLLNHGEGRLRAARIRAFLEALRVPSLPDLNNDKALERALVLSEKDRIDLEIRFPSSADNAVDRLVMVEAKFRHRLTGGQLKTYGEARRKDFKKIDYRIIGLTLKAGNGRRGRQIPLWRVLLWRDVWLQFEKRRPRETDEQIETFMAWLWRRIGALNPEARR